MPNDPILHMLGLARKAGRLELGEEPVGAVCRSRHARLILLALDAAPNTHRRAAHFGEIGGGVLAMELPFTKAELGALFDRGSCAMMALTDAGFAASVLDKLAARNPERYGPAALQMRQKADRMLQRQREKRQHEKNLREGKRKPWAPPPSKQEKPVSLPHPTGKGKGQYSKPKPPGQGASAHSGKEDVLRSSRPKKPGPGGRRLSGTIPKKRGGYPV